MADKNKRPDEITNQVAGILDHLEIAVYVSDLETNRILFANQELRLIHGGMPLIGQICWETLWNATKRCDFCPIPYLLKNPGKSYRGERTEEDRQFQVYDSIIPWSKGKLAHLHYMIEKDMESPE